MKTESLGKIAFIILSVLVLKNAFLNAYTIHDMKGYGEITNPPPPGIVTIPDESKR